MIASRSVLGLVELSPSNNGGPYTNGSSRVLSDVFQDRLKGWVRAKDQWRLIKNNRICVILKDIGSSGELELAAAKLGRIFDQPHFHMGRSLPLSVNAGFAEITENGRDMSTAMEQAGLALTQAKRSHRLFDVYSDDCTKALPDERALVSKLEQALEVGELHLYFQPKIHAAYHSLLGAEALLRWHTSDKQVLTPDHFIEVADNFGLPLVCACLMIHLQVKYSGTLARSPSWKKKARRMSYVTFFWSITRIGRGVVNILEDFSVFPTGGEIETDTDDLINTAVWIFIIILR